MSKNRMKPQTPEQLNSIRYLPGRPRQYRFNAQTGRFNINGTEDVGDSFTIQPVAWRIFEDDLFARGRVETWAELFFVDSKSALSSLMFNNSSINELYRLIERLFYDDLKLSDVILTITSEKKVNEKITPKGTWYLANFKYIPADATAVVELAAYAQSHPIFRAETITEAANHNLVSDLYAFGMSLPLVPMASTSLVPRLAA